MIIPTMSETSHLRLLDWGVIRAQGADAASFLHGQLTQDVALLDRDHARLAGFCTAKGRLLATGTPTELARSDDAYVAELLQTPRRQAQRLSALLPDHDAA